jgi:hypothetical protein
MILFRHVSIGTAVSGGDGMDSRCVVPGVHGFLLLRPIMASA